ncbi:MAG: hypothetical protein ABIL76_07535, partial [candidate division WOR-3 bacterium]
EINSNYEEYKLLKCIKLIKTRVKTLIEFFEYGDYFLTENYKIDEKAFNELINENSINYLKILYERYKNVLDWKKEILEKILRDLANELSIKPAQIIHPLRIVLTGKTIGPSLFELVEELGKDIVLKRIERFIK